MTRRTLLNTTALVAVAATLSFAPISADAHAVVSRSDVLATITVGASSTDWTNELLAIPAFDSTKGSLQSVLVFQQLTANYAGSAAYTSGTGSATATLFAATPLSITNGPSTLNGPAVLTATASQPMSFAGTESSPFNQTDVETTGPFLLSGAIGDWARPGGGMLLADLTTISTSNAPEGLAFSPDPLLTYVLNVTYNYTTTAADPVPAPEPASALMLGAGVIGLAAARGRRKHRTG